MSENIKMVDPSDPFSLSGKNIIVTGASSGIGRQCAISCSHLGAKIVLTGRNEERLQETLSMMADNALHKVCNTDLTDYEKVAIRIEEIIKETGPVDGLINCAGISTTLPLAMVKADKMEEFFNINVQAAVNLTRIVTRVRNFSANGGSIIFISSVMSEAGESGKMLYSITKGALTSGARSLAVELAPRKIRVNSVSPGVVDTPMSKTAVYSRNEEALAAVKKMHPLGLGKPEDVALACAFLLSDASVWITGTNLIIDGGYLAR